jgi:PAS domain S-box-containing protein
VAKQHATNIYSDSAGRIWVSTYEGDIITMDKGNIVDYPRKPDSPLRYVEAFAEHAPQEIWAGGEGGLVLINGGHVRLIRPTALDSLENVTGIVDAAREGVWLNTSSGVIHIPKDEVDLALRDPSYLFHWERFDSSDGLPGQTVDIYPFPKAVQGTDGRIWFTATRGVAWVDPKSKVLRNTLPPPVSITSMSANDALHQQLTDLRLPAHTANVQINYTALSLSVPERVHFRYKLESHDSEWQDPGTRRQAFYSDLRPGNYRFRVMACNNDGVWNEEGATLAFSVAAAWYQTWWFRGILLVVFLALLWALYQLRIQQIQRREKQLRDVIDTIPALAFSSSPDGKNECVNRRWVEYSGLSKESSSGSGWRSMIHPDDLEEHMKKWQRSLTSSEPFENESRRLSANGEYRWFLSRAVPLRDAHGNILKWYGTLTDIEDRKQAEQERERLHRLHADLAHVNRISMMGELSASLSHELRQPIAAAITNANTCLRWLKRDQPDVEEACEATMRIVKDGNRAAEIINRLRSFYKKGSSPERELVDANDVVGEMLVLLRSEANQNSVSMHTELSSDLPKVRADRVQVQQVCLNLMLNAIEAMKDTGGELTISSGLTDDGQLLISVSDTGMGLPAEQADQIFETFFTTKPDGSGMGLAISRSIVESHGGRLWAGVNVQRGATFYFTLPSERI